MNILQHILTITLTIATVYCFHLTHNQMKTIHKLIRSVNIEPIQRETIDLLLYKAYEKWAIKQAVVFTRKHPYKCHGIKIEEVIFSSKIGLFKSIKKYDGRYHFTNYSAIYIHFELLRLLTDKYALSVIPKQIRRKSKLKMSALELRKYKSMLNVKLSSAYEPWQSAQMCHSQEITDQTIITKYEKEHMLYELLNKLSPFAKRIVYLQFYVYPNKHISNNYMSNLMGCSDETIRQERLHIKQILLTL